MKKVFIVVLVIFVLWMMVGCGASQQPEASPLVGKWKGADLLDETYEFKADGTGHNENSLFPYDFEYKTDENKLSIYAEIFGMTSDEPMVFTYSIDNNILTLVDESIDVTYEYKKS